MASPASRRRTLQLVLVGSALACIAAQSAVAARGASPVLMAVAYITKPLATIAALLLAWTAARPVSPAYRKLVTLGLAASLAGDVFLMLPGDLFLPGLASFLVAHLLYVTAFAGDGGGARDVPVFLVVALFGAAMLVVLWPALGAMRVPVLAYVGVIATMAWQAIARWRAMPRAGAGDGDGARRGAAALAAFGAASFLVSDAALAVGRFRGAFAGGTAVVLGTYWLAQWGIARSVETEA